MAQVTNNFEGGTSGTTVSLANSGGTSGNAFDVVNVGTATTVAFDNAHSAHGGLSCQLATAATSASAFVSWTTSMGSQAQAWFRSYFYFTANPAVQHRILNFLSGATAVGNVLLKTNGTLIFTNSAGGTVLTTATAIPLGSWWRLEGFLTGSAAAGQWEFRLFTSNPDGTTPDETQTSAASQAMGGPVTVYRFGIGANIVSTGPFWIDDIGLSSTGYLGPAVTTWTGAGTAAATSGASGAFTPAAVAGTAAGTSSAAGAFQPAAIAGTAPAASTAAGTLALATAVSAAPAASASSASGAFQPAALAGSASSASSAAGSFLPVATAGTAPGGSSASGTLTLSPATAGGTAAASASASGAFKPAMLAGTAGPAGSLASAALALAPAVIAGTAWSTPGAAGELTAALPLAGSAGSVPQAAGTLTALALAGTSVTLTAASAGIPPGGSLSGAATAVSLAAGLLARTFLVFRAGKLHAEITAASVLPGAEAGRVIGPMGLARIVSTDPVRNILIAMRTLEQPDGTPVNPVTAALPVSVAFVPVGLSPDTAAWLAADWITAVDGSFRVRCQVGSGATGALTIGRYQPYVRVQNGGETITVPAADVLEAY